MTRYARYSGNSHRQEHEATDWSDMKSTDITKIQKRLATEAEDVKKAERSEGRRLKRQENKKSIAFTYIHSYIHYNTSFIRLYGML